MNIKPIHNKNDLKKALSRIDEIIDANHGTPEYDELEILSILVEKFEEKHYPVLPPDPIILTTCFGHFVLYRSG
ncbi:MAG TPA: hypothetical protein VHP36_00175 [Chitinispirillaceae bacterium]|nr:hypothetical protein [Chitinispirillaceae bacterium]